MRFPPPFPFPSLPVMVKAIKKAAPQGTPMKKAIGKGMKRAKAVGMVAKEKKVTVANAMMKASGLQGGRPKKGFTRKLLPNNAELVTFEGTSGSRSLTTRSVVPCAMYKASLTAAELEKIKKPWDAYMQTPAWADLEMVQNRPEYKQKEAFFRMCPEVPQLASNGGDFKQLAPADCHAWWAQLASKNAAFYQALEQNCAALRYDTNQGKQPAFLVKKPNFGKNLFAYMTLQQREWPETKKPGPGRTSSEKEVQSERSPNYVAGAWHADGGPSSIFLAVTLEGDRVLEVENADGEVHQLHLKPGDFYVSQPSSFWHNVRFVEGKRGGPPSLALIARSAVLKRRLSGGRTQSDGKRTPGMTYKTKKCFEEMSAKVRDCIVDMSEKMGFSVV